MLPPHGTWVIEAGLALDAMQDGGRQSEGVLMQYEIRLISL